MGRTGPTSAISAPNRSARPDGLEQVREVPVAAEELGAAGLLEVRYQNHAHGAVELQNPLHQLATIPPCHPQVGNQDAHPSGMTLENRSASVPRAATAGRVAQASNHATDPEAFSMVGVHDED